MPRIDPTPTIPVISMTNQDAASPASEPVLERPTLRCLGAYWIIRGDDNKNGNEGASGDGNGSGKIEDYSIGAREYAFDFNEKK